MASATPGSAASCDSTGRLSFHEPLRSPLFARRIRRRRVRASNRRSSIANWAQARGRPPCGCINTSPSAAIRPLPSPTWKQLIDQESARLEKSGETSNEIVLGLEWNLADLVSPGRTISRRSATSSTGWWNSSGEGSDETLVSLLDWMTKNKSWDVLDAFLDKHQHRLEQNKRPLYYAALARAQQGKHDLAELLASTAAEIQTAGHLEGFRRGEGLGGAQPIRVGRARVSQGDRQARRCRTTTSRSILASIYLCETAARL